MDIWTISKKGLLIMENESPIAVKYVKASNQLQRVLVQTETRGEFTLTLRCFKPEKDVAFDQNCKVSRSAFLKWIQSNTDDKTSYIYGCTEYSVYSFKAKVYFSSPKQAINDNQWENDVDDCNSSNSNTNINETQLPDHSTEISTCNKKLLGKSILVPVENLIQPTEMRAVRDIDNNHVDELEKQFEKTQGSYGVLLGVVFDENVTIEDVKLKGRCQIEVIGGNHTRQAIGNLNLRGSQLISHVTMDVYRSLSDIESIKLGLLHNSQHEYSKVTSFEDKVKLFRRLYLIAQTKFPEKQRKCAVLHRDMVADVMGIDRKKARNTIEVHLQVSTFPEDIWALFVEFADAWKRKEISGQPKTQLRQTHVKNLLSLKSEDEKKAYLNDLIDKRRNFQHERVRQKNSSDRIEDLKLKYSKLKTKFNAAEETIKQQDKTIKALETDIRVHECRDNTNNEKELMSEKQKVRDYQQTVETMKKTGDILKKKTKMLQTENADLRMTVKDLSQRLEHAETAAARARKSSRETPLQTYRVTGQHNTVQQHAFLASSGTSSEENKECAAKRQLESDKGTPNKKVKFSVGEKVWAFYEPDDRSYPARVVQTEGSSYLVRFIEDGVEVTVSNTEIWRFSKK